MILRFLYICLLRLHPRRFRQRFGDEMLWIFDQGHRRRTVPLFADAFLSLWRQWALRSDFWQEPVQQPASDGVPVFYIGGNDTPRSSALIHGAALSMLVFGAVCYILNHSNSHRPFVFMIGSHNHSFSHFLETRSLNAAPAELATQIKVKPEPAVHRVSPYFRLMPVLMALDRDNDGVISASEVANAAVALLTLDKSGDNKLSAEECGLGAPNASEALRRSYMRRHPVLAALDADHDGEISAGEILNAPAALLTLDKNHDGQLTEDELLPAPVLRSLPAAAR
jgi:hypothetical protein